MENTTNMGATAMKKLLTATALLMATSALAHAAGQLNLQNWGHKHTPVGVGEGEGAQHRL